MHETTTQSPRRITLAGAAFTVGNGDLPEEVVDYVDHLSGVDIDEDHIVIIPYPLIGAIDRRQTIRPRVADEIPRLEEQTVEEKPDAQPVIPMRAKRGVIPAKAEGIAVDPTMVAPPKPAVIAPSATIPAAKIPTASVETVIAAPEITAHIAASGSYPVTEPVAPYLAILKPVAAALVAHPVAKATALCAVDTAVVAPVETVATIPVGTLSIAAIDPIGAAITAAFDPVSAAITAAFDPICSAITAILYPVGAPFAAPINLVGAVFASAIDPVGPALAAIVHAFCAAFGPVDALYALAGVCALIRTVFAYAPLWSLLPVGTALGTAVGTAILP